MLQALQYSGLAVLAMTMAPLTSRADDDWEDYLEDRRERLEDAREDYQDYLEDLRENRRGYRGLAPRPYVPRSNYRRYYQPSIPAYRNYYPRRTYVVPQRRYIRPRSGFYLNFPRFGIRIGW